MIPNHPKVENNEKYDNFRIADMRQNRKLLKAEEPNFDKIELIPIGDPKSAEKAFLAGDIDFTHVSESSVPGFKENTPDGATLTVRPSLDYFWLGINKNHPKYQDVRIRKAIGKAIDIDAILDGAFFGAAQSVTKTFLRTPCTFSMARHRKSALLKM